MGAGAELFGVRSISLKRKCGEFIREIISGYTWGDDPHLPHRNPITAEQLHR